MNTAQEVAQDAADNSVVQAFARAGFAANGLVHILIGILVIAVAVGGEGETDQAGAFKAVGQAPLGFVALWVVAVALWGLAVWHVAEGIQARGDGRWGTRVSEWGQAAVFAAIGAIAAAVALGARPNAEESAQDASRGALDTPGGVFVLGAVGLGVTIAGISFIVMGVMRSFEKKMTIPAKGVGPAVKTLGIFGFIAKGIALGIVGILLIIAAVTVDAETAGGLDGAVQALMEMTAGPFLAGAVGIGFIAYGVFCGFRARYARL